MGAHCSSISNNKRTRKTSFDSKISRESLNLETKLNNYLFYNTFNSSSLRLIVDSIYCFEKIKSYCKNRDKLLNLISKEFESKDYSKLKTLIPITQLNKESCEKVEILKIFHSIAIKNKDFFIDILIKGPANEFRWYLYLTKSLFADYNFIYYNIYKNFIDITLTDDLEEQIKKDLTRTCLEVENFNNESNLEVLYNVLKAHANYDKELSYCPGMNTIAACLIVLSDKNELEVFNMMVYLFSADFNYKLRDFFINGFPKLSLFIFYIRELMKCKLKLIYNS